MELDPYNYNTTVSISKKKDFNSYDSKLADKYVYHCLDCKKCWEIKVGYRVNKKGGKRNIKDFISYYFNFPTYGKQKKQCPRCEDNK
mgnify:CR=1 FL=1